ncbi:MAG: class I SAM-dependent methyltransferase [Flavobacteriales bacterium]
MDYDPVKDSLGSFFNRSSTLRKVFYRLLDIVLLRSWHIQREIRKWRRSAPQNAHILDAGSGFGQYSWYFSRLSKEWTILGVDVKRDYIADCNDFFRDQGRSNVYFKVADLTQLKDEGAYDLILSVDVMEHIEEDVLVFRNFYKALRSGGVLLISTPSDKGGSDALNNHGKSFIGEHVRDGYNMQEIKEKLKSAGFCKVKAHYSYGIPGRMAWKFAMKWPMKMLGWSKGLFIILPVYYIIFLIPILILHYLDTYSPHRSGTGLIVRAEKNGITREAQCK